MMTVALDQAVLPLPFMKMSGSGNDFILIDNRKSRIDTMEMQDFARHVCRRKFSVGADGLILIEEAENVHFRWRFFNADGSEAEMCGNGARCAARFAYMNGIAPARMCFETVAGVVEAQVADLDVSVKMPPPKDFQIDRTIEVNGVELVVHSVDTGVPHAVIFTEDINGIDVCSIGSAIRHHELFKPAGSNVNFVGLEKEGISVRTYERGVEDETMACGTGAVASALLAALDEKVQSPVQVVTSGGEILSISFDLAAGPSAEKVYLKGAAHLIYKGELTIEALVC